MTFELSDRCDDLLVQLDFLRRQTQESVERPDPASDASSSWSGQICRALATVASRSRLRKEQAKSSQRRRFTMLDLAALGPLKERLATYHLLDRSSQKMPELRRVIKESRAGIKASEQRLAEIVRRCGRDVETDQLVVPPKFAKPYAEELTYRKETTRLLRTSSTLLKAMVIRLTRRLNEPKLLGRAGTPSLRVLPPLPETIEALPMSDDDLGKRIVELETLLKSPLGGPRPDPKRAMAPPSAPPPLPGAAAAQPGALEGTAAAGAPTEHAAPEAPAERPRSEHSEGGRPGHAEEHPETAGADDFLVFDEPEQGET